MGLFDWNKTDATAGEVPSQEGFVPLAKNLNQDTAAPVAWVDPPSAESAEISVPSNDGAEVQKTPGKLISTPSQRQLVGNGGRLSKSGSFSRSFSRRGSKSGVFFSKEKSDATPPIKKKFSFRKPKDEPKRQDFSELQKSLVPTNMDEEEVAAHTQKVEVKTSALLASLTAKRDFANQLTELEKDLKTSKGYLAKEAEEIEQKEKALNKDEDYKKLGGLFGESQKLVKGLEKQLSSTIATLQTLQQEYAELAEEKTVSSTVLTKRALEASVQVLSEEKSEALAKIAVLQQKLGITDEEGDDLFKESQARDLSKYLAAVRDTILGCCSSMATTVASIPTGSYKVSQKAWNGTMDVSQKAWNGTVDVSQKVWSGTMDVSQKAWSGTKDMSQKAWDSTKSVSSKALNGVQTAPGHVAKAAEPAVSKAVEITNKAIEQLKKILEQISEVLKTYYGKASEKIKPDFDKYGKPLVDWLKEKLDPLLAKASELVSATMEKVQPHLDKAWAKMYPYYRKYINPYKEGELVMADFNGQGLQPAVIEKKHTDDTYEITFQNGASEHVSEKMLRKYDHPPASAVEWQAAFDEQHGLHHVKNHHLGKYFAFLAVMTAFIVYEVEIYLL